MLPVFTLLALLASAGAGIWLAALNVKYRDFRYVVPFIVQFGLYISPVGFSSAIVPAKWRLLYDFNPMVGVIDGFRWAVSNGRSAFPAAKPRPLAHHHRDPARQRHLVFPQNGTHLRGRDLSTRGPGRVAQNCGAN